jgi:hypothetical protein
VVIELVGTLEELALGLQAEAARMAFIKIIVPCLVGEQWRNQGETVEVSARLAEAHVKAGTAEPIAPPPRTEAPPEPIEQATAEPKGEHAVSPRGHHKPAR